MNINGTLDVLHGPVTERSALLAAELLTHAKEGSRSAQHIITESIAQGDLPSQLTPYIRRTLLARYNEVDPVYPKFTQRTLVQSIDIDEQYNSYWFNQNNIANQNMGDGWLPDTLPAIGNRESYPQLSLQASGKTVRASRIGEAFGLDWAAIINSRGMNVNLIDDAIYYFARHARNTEDAKPVQQLFTSTGVNTNVVTGDVQVAGNPTFSLAILQQLIAKAQTYYIDGVQVFFDKFVLLTPYQNQAQVKQVLSTTQIRSTPAYTGSLSTAPQFSFEQQIALGADVEVVPNRWITTINPALSNAWALIPVGTQRPALTANFLAGYETPSFWVKDANARAYNGGEVNPLLDGDFDSDAIQTKVRHVYGSSALWTQGMFVSTGLNA